MVWPERKLEKKHTHHVHPRTWGRFPIWRSYFSDGLVQPPTIGLQEKKSPSHAFRRYNLQTGTTIQQAGDTPERDIVSRKRWLLWVENSHNMTQQFGWNGNIHLSNIHLEKSWTMTILNGRGPPCRWIVFRSRRLEAPEHVIVHFWDCRKTLCFQGCFWSRDSLVKLLFTIVGIWHLGVSISWICNGNQGVVLPFSKNKKVLFAHDCGFKKSIFGTFSCL